MNMTNPTIEQMRIEVLEWQGWTWSDSYVTAWGAEVPLKAWHNPEGRKQERPPLTLDWWHECWLKMNKTDKAHYFAHLLDFVDGQFPISWPDLIKLESATAEQRLTALYKTIKI